MPQEGKEVDEPPWWDLCLEIFWNYIFLVME